MRKALQVSFSLVYYMADAAIKPPAEKCKAQQEVSLLLKRDVADNRFLRLLGRSFLSVANDVLMDYAAS